MAKMDDRQIKILTIDDEPSIRESFKRYLEDYDYLVIEAEDGQDGLELFRKEKPDLILVDLRMPNVDGLEVLATVKKESPQTPVIVISGTGLIDDAIEAIRQGAWDFLLKPVKDLSMLLYSVERTLEKARLVRENEQYQKKLEDLVEERTKELNEANQTLYEANRRLREVVETTRKLSINIKSEKFMNYFLSEFAYHMRARGGALYLVEGDELVLAATLDSPPHAPLVISYPLDKGSIIEHTLESKQPTLIEDITQHQEFKKSKWRSYDDNSLLCFPLIDENGDNLGVLTLHNSSKEHFTEQDREIGFILLTYSSEAIRIVRVIEELRKSEERYSGLLERLNEAVFRINFPEGNCEYMSPACLDVFGYDINFFLKQNNFPLHIVHPDYRERFNKRWEEIKKGLLPSILEYKIKDKSGKSRWISQTGTAIHNEKGDLLAIECCCTNISQRKSAEEELQRLQSYMKNIIESMSSIIISVDRDSKITLWNKTASRVIQLKTGWAKNQNLATLFPGSDRLAEEVKVVIEKKSPTFRHREQLPMQKDSYFDLFIYPLKIGGKIEGAVIRMDDITEKEEIEQQLVQAQKMEIIGTLVGGIAHDFNNALSGIVTTVSLLKLELETSAKIEEVLSYLQIIEYSGNRATSVVKQLLALSRKTKLMFTNVNLNDSISHIVKVCNNSFDKSVKLDINLFPESAMINADITQIEQVLLNLCINASHSMTIMRPENAPQGGTLGISVEHKQLDKVFCLLHAEASEGSYYIVRVSDSGVGIEKSRLNKIFEPFYTTKKKEMGTGLGLAMVYNIIKQHKGFIDVYSESGVGTAFNIYLPALDDSTEASKKENNKQELPRGEGTALIIDDDEMIRNIIEKLLIRCGYKVVVARDGREGLNTFKEMEGRFTLIFLDMSMPELSGNEVYKEMIAYKKDIKVLLASGFENDRRIEEIRNMGAKHFIQKPFNVNEFINKLNALL